VSRSSERLYESLPAVVRRRDAEQGEPLRALAAVLQAEWDALEAEAETLWDDWSIETCEEWVVPYIGASLGVEPLREVASVDFSLRSYVANTLARRRRKGTAAATEQLARDVTGYPALAVELFTRTLVSTHLGHLRGADRRPAPIGTVDLRDTRALEAFGGPFDAFARSADVRPIDRGVVRPNLPNLALHLWRVRSWELSGVSSAPVPGADGWYRIDPTGVDAPLFNLPRGEDDITALARPEHVPHRLTRLDLEALVADRDADPPVVVHLEAGGTRRTLAVHSCDLSDTADGGLPESRRPAAGTVAVDPVLGRLALAPEDVAPDAAVTVDHSVGRPGAVGAGPFDRSDALVEQLPRRPDGTRPRAGTELDAVRWHRGVGRTGDGPADDHVHPTLDAAVAEWNAFVAARPAGERAEAIGLITVDDSRTYAAPAQPIDLPDGARLHVVAATWLVTTVDGVPHRAPGDIAARGVRPLVRGDLLVQGTGAAGTPSGGLFLNGLLVDGAVRVLAGDLSQLDLAHCTVASAGGGPGLVVEAEPEEPGRGNVSLAVRLTACVSAAVRAADPIDRVDLLDTIAVVGDEDANGFVVDLGGGDVSVRSSTTVGGIRATTLTADDAILAEGHVPPADAIAVDQPQEGCLRHSYVPWGSITPRRYRCQPDLALVGVADPAARARVVARVRPSFRGLRPSDPRLGLLGRDGPPELLTTSSDADEPGVWHHLRHATRLANLGAALRNHLRFGLDAGTIHHH
jgi:hypothetical protein